MAKKQIGIIPSKMEPTRACSPENIYGTMAKYPDPAAHDDPKTEEEGLSEQPPNQDQDSQPICLLVLGPTGSGKSSFIANLLNLPSSDPMIGHNTIDSHTTTITPYLIPNTNITLLDTPALNPDTFLPFLSTLATFLSQPSTPQMTGIILTHPITLNRLTNSTRQSLNLIKSLCGPDFFFSHTLLLTTMWDKTTTSTTSTNAAHAALVQREAQLLASPNFWASPPSSGKTIRFKDKVDGTTDLTMTTLLELFLDYQQPPQQTMMKFQQEIISGMDVKDTAAGRLVLGEQQDRKRKVEAELSRVKEGEESRLKDLQQNATKLDRQIVARSSRPYKEEDGMAYGSVPSPELDERDERRTGERDERHKGRNLGLSMPNSVRGLASESWNWASNKLASLRDSL
ncbi:hypothetical protein QBC38DRAFT_490895 [Podospora fimiseda]|uniref:G domain-containing protein n=1 Tax=Podospora fimiseda TaxID=252190 RepID=A0AAN6YMU2_9PEZI|nr:hypothetical protein QBC38DRAFT_490895 [Podospora fimiseda]